MNNDTTADAITVTQADKDLLEALQAVTTNGYVGGYIMEAEGLEIIARHRRTSLAAQDGLVEHFPSGLRQKRHEIATAGDVVDGPVCVDCHCGASFSATDEQEARQLWAEHALASIEVKSS